MYLAAAAAMNGDEGEDDVIEKGPSTLGFPGPETFILERL